MAYSTLTPEQFQARYPAFSGVSVDTIALVIPEAAQYVDDSWPSQLDFTRGQMLYTAHELTRNGLGDTSEAAVINEGGSGLKRLKAGDTEIEWAGAGSGGGSSAAGLNTTSFGRDLNALIRRLFGGGRFYRAAGWPASDLAFDGDPPL